MSGQKHHISKAGELFAGKTDHAGLIAVQGRDGVALAPFVRHDYGAPAALDADGIAVAQAVAGAGNLALNGVAVTDGIAVLDTPRNVTIASAGNDSGITFTIYGMDMYGEPMAETLTGANAGTASGKKAFKKVTRIAASAAAAGNVNAGWAHVMGLPYRVDYPDQIVKVVQDGAEDTGYTLVVADTNTATAITGDVRGTVNATAANDGSKRFVVYMVPSGADSRENLLGVAQYAG